MVSSSGTEPEPPRGGAEPGRLERPADLGAEHEVAVGFLDRQLVDGAAPHEAGESGGGLGEVTRVRREREHRLAAPLEVERELPVDEHDETARLAARAMTLAVRPGQRGTVGI